MDTFLSQAINGLAGLSPAADRLAVFLASYLQYVLVAAFLSYLVWVCREWAQRKRLALIALASVALSRGFLTEVIRYFYHRPRPFTALEFPFPLIDVRLDEYFNSFPSGHAAFFFALAAALYLHDKKWGWWFFAAAALMGLARVFAGVHWPTDIVGGAVIGIASAWLVRKLWK